MRESACAGEFFLPGCRKSTCYASGPELSETMLVSRTAWLFTLLLLASVPAPATAQEWARKMFEESNHNFGAVARGAKAEYRFTFTNLYKEDVHVSGVRSSCGCTTPQITKETLKTYEKGEVVAQFNTAAFQGEKSATLTVTFDQPFRAEVQLQVSGYIRTDVVLNPGSVVFGSVERGAPVEKNVEIKYAGRNDWMITAIESSNPHLTTKLQEMSRGDGQVSYNLLVTLLENAPVGYIKEQLIMVTNDARAKQIPVDVEGRVQSEITVSPTSLFMGVLQPGQKATKQLLVRGKEPFKIIGVSCEDESFTFTAPQTAKSFHLVPVTFVAGNEPGKVTQKVHIETDLGEGAVPDFNVYAQIVAAE